MDKLILLIVVTAQLGEFALANRTDEEVGPHFGEEVLKVEPRNRVDSKVNQTLLKRTLPDQILSSKIDPHTIPFLNSDHWIFQEPAGRSSYADPSTYLRIFEITRNRLHKLGAHLSLLSDSDESLSPDVRERRRKFRESIPASILRKCKKYEEAVEALQHRIFLAMRDWEDKNPQKARGLSIDEMHQLWAALDYIQHTALSLSRKEAKENFEEAKKVLGQFSNISSEVAAKLTPNYDSPLVHDNERALKGMAEKYPEFSQAWTPEHAIQILDRLQR